MHLYIAGIARMDVITRIAGIVGITKLLLFISITTILSYPILSYHIISYHIISYPILSYPILSYPILIQSPLFPFPINVTQWTCAMTRTCCW